MEPPGLPLYSLLPRYVCDQPTWPGAVCSSCRSMEPCSPRPARPDIFQFSSAYFFSIRIYARFCRRVLCLSSGCFPFYYSRHSFRQVYTTTGCASHLELQTSNFTLARSDYQYYHRAGHLPPTIPSNTRRPILSSQDRPRLYAYTHKDARHAVPLPVHYCALLAKHISHLFPPVLVGLVSC